MRTRPSSALMVRSGRALTAALCIALLGAAVAGAGPRAKIDPPEITLGRIDEGKSFERELTLTNVGDGVLILEDVKTTCGCTAAAVESVVELAAGESQTIKVTFSSKNMEGEIKKKVTIYTNDEKHPQTPVLLVADVHKPVRWVPKYITLNKVRPSDDFEERIVLQADRDLGIEVGEAKIVGPVKRVDGSAVSKPSELFDLELLERRVEDDRDVFEYRVTIRPDATPQKVTETIYVTTNLGGDRDTVKTLVRGEIVGRITASPTFAVLRMVDPGQEALRDLVLTASEGTFNVLGAQVDDCPVEVTIVPHEDKSQTTIRLRYVGEEPGVSGVRQLRITTDDPEQPLIEVPLRYQTRSPEMTASGRKPPMSISDRAPK